MKSYYSFEADSQRKIHLNLPAQSWEILTDDIYSFSENNNAVGFSNIISRIVINYIDNKLPPANIEYESQKFKQIISDNIGKHKELDQKTNLKKSLETAIEDFYIKETQIKYTAPKEIGKKIDLNKECCTALSDISEYTANNTRPLISRVFESIPLFIRAIMLDYTRQPISKRNIIYNHKIYNSIKQAISHNTSVTVSTKNNTPSFDIIPYDIVEDTYHEHTYFIGLRESTRNCSNPILLKLEKIRKIIPATTKTSLSIEEKATLKQLITEQGVAYLRNKNEVFCIKMTEEGEKKYRERLFQRPHHEKQTEEETAQHIYRFTGSKYQIMNYFRRFGADAIIISPTKVAEEMIAEYKATLKAYKDALS